MLVDTIPEALDKLFQDSGLTTCTPLRESRRIMIMTVYLVFVLIIAVFRSEDSRADRTGEVLDMIFSI